MHKLTIDIVSDIACPWCAIGYARLEQAMEELKSEMDFDLHWHAFELNPGSSGHGLPILEALSRKYGRSPEDMEAAQNNMMAIAKDLGLNFTKMQERLTSNTFDAHRLVKWADQQGKATEMKKACFDAYFGHAEQISDADVLVRCVESIGLDGPEARAVLASDRYAQVVRDDEATYQQAGVSAVPAFIVNGQYMISGAQEPDTLVRSFQQIVNKS